MSKASASRAASGFRGAKREAADDGLAASPLGLALVGDADSRKLFAVQDALDWWLQYLPASGVELATELNAPGELLEAFRRGRLVSAGRGQRLIDEGDEVRQYTIVLMGRCRLRCRVRHPNVPAVTTTQRSSSFRNRAAADAGASATSKADEADDGGGDGLGLDYEGNDGLAVCGAVGRGESLGLAPGDQRSPYEAICMERSVLLLLGMEDYAASLRPYHRRLQAEAAEFLQRHGVCPQATPFQLQRLTASLRHRRVLRGAVLARAGDPQRVIWILRDGRCSMLLTAEEAAVAAKPAEEKGKGKEEESTEYEASDVEERIAQMRSTSCGAEVQQAGEAQRAERAVIAKYARGRLRRELEEPSPPAVVPSHAGATVATASIADPGSVIGEEALVFDGAQAPVRCCYNVRAEEESLFYSVDLSCFRHLAACMGPEHLAEVVKEKLNLHVGRLGRGHAIAKRLTRQRRWLQRRDMQNQERPKLRLPRCVGYDGIEELEDVNDWLRIVLQHRKAPPNPLNPTNLSCLEALGISPLGNTVPRWGPGTETMLRLYNDQAALKKHRSTLRWGHNRSNGSFDPDTTMNPMGNFIPSNARYGDTSPQGWDELTDAECSMEFLSELSGEGIFFQTEPELENVQPPAPPAPPVPRVAPRPAPVRSSSVPVLPRILCTGTDAFEEPSVILDQRRSVSQRSLQVTNGTRTQKLMRSFHKAVVGKSILVLTDKRDVRKFVLKSMVSLGLEVSVSFLKSTNELWTRLRDTKEQHHTLLLDLQKSELQVEGIVRILRQHEKYGKLPIVVFAADRALPEIVRSCCSFVVYYPLSVPMLREALLWCLDRKALQEHAAYEVPSPEPETPASTLAQFALSIVAMPLERG